MKKKIIILSAVLSLFLPMIPKQTEATGNTTGWLDEIVDSGGATLTGAAALVYLVGKSIYDQSSVACWGKVCRGLGQCFSGKLCKRVLTSVMDPYFPPDMPDEVKKLLTLMGRSLHKEVESLNKTQRGKAREEVGTEERPVFLYDLPTGTKYTFISLNSDALKRQASEEWQASKDSLREVQDYGAFASRVYTAFKGQDIRRYMDATRPYHDSFISRMNILFNKGDVKLRILSTGSGDVDVYLFGNGESSRFGPMYVLRVEHTDTQDIDFFGASGGASVPTRAARSSGGTSPQERLLLGTEVEMGGTERVPDRDDEAFRIFSGRRGCQARADEMV